MNDPTMPPIEPTEPAPPSEVPMEPTEPAPPPYDRTEPVYLPGVTYNLYPDYLNIPPPPPPSQKKRWWLPALIAFLLVVTLSGVGYAAFTYLPSHSTSQKSPSISHTKRTILPTAHPTLTPIPTPTFTRTPSPTPTLTPTPAPYNGPTAQSLLQMFAQDPHIDLMYDASTGTYIASPISDTDWIQAVGYYPGHGSEEWTDGSAGANTMCLGVFNTANDALKAADTLGATNSLDVCHDRYATGEYNTTYVYGDCLLVYNTPLSGQPYITDLQAYEQDIQNAC